MEQKVNDNSSGSLGSKKYLLLTFDYELFLGTNSGSAEKCMIEPTRLLLEIFKKTKLKHALFFVDTTYLQKLIESKNETSQADLKTIREQLIYLIKEGHYVFPHIHPHWKDAVFNEKTNRWNLENARFYRFHFLEETERSQLFQNSINIIKDLQKEAGIAYSIDSYRAGGWCIQPFSDFKPYFEKHDIKHDFSVLKGHSNLNERNFYNFTSVPPKSIYKFTDEVVVEVKEDGRFYEFVISSIKKSSGMQKIIERIFNKYLWLTENKSMGDGYSISKPGEKGEVNDSKMEMASLELMTAMNLNKYYRFLKDENYLQIISHPKMLSKHNLKIFQRFLKSATDKYELITDYKLMLN